MNFQNNRYTLRFADSTDNSGIREVFESGSFSGGLSVQYLRNPAPFESFAADGEEPRILVAKDNETGHIVAVGGAVIRREYINGSIEKCAYLTGLKIVPEYRRRISFISKAYQLLHESVADCRCCYTTILDDNKEAIAMLEKKHRNMPDYKLLDHYTTYCFHGGKRLADIEVNNMEGFDELFERHFAARDLTPADHTLGGFGAKDFYCLRENGKIIACCFVGDQQMHKQYKMCSYDGIYRIISKLPTRLIGYPQFPQAGSIINHGVVSYLYVKDRERGLCSDFLRTVAAHSHFSLLLWGCTDRNPLSAAMKSMKTVHYGSRLYSVQWDQKDLCIGADIGLEVALL